MSGLSGRSASLNGARGPAHGTTRRGVRLILFGGLVVAALVLAACQPHGAVLQGRLTDSEAGRLAGVQVRVYSSTTETVVASTRTDRDGDWSFMPDALADGTYRILFSESSWWDGSTSWADATDVAVVDGSTRVVDAMIDAAKGSVAGTVTDGADPLGGVQVSARTVSGHKVVAKAVTAGDGTYAFDVLAAGDYRFEFSHSGYATRYSDGATSPANAPIVTVDDGDSVAGIDTVLVSEASISGTLSDGTAPVDHGLIAVYDLTHERWVDLVPTSADGRFSFGGLNTGLYTIGFPNGSGDGFGFYGDDGNRGDGDDDPASGTPIRVLAGQHVDLGTLMPGTMLYPPTAPARVTATAGDTRIEVHWVPAAADGGSAITGYAVTATPGGATCTTTDAISCFVDGLSNGTPYTFTVTATNAIGTSPVSAASAPVTPHPAGQWEKFTTYGVPPARFLAGIAARPDGTAVLFGGSSDQDQTALGDTWVWNGSWVGQHPTTAPSPRFGATMAPLPDGRTLLFGGTDQSGTPMGDTWIFDGTDWALQTPADAPPARYYASSTALSNGDVLLFSGAGPSALDDTWLWKDSNWVKLEPAATPPSRMTATMAALPGGRAMLFGGYDNHNNGLSDTWIFDGADWVEQPVTSPSPSARAGASATQLADGDVLVIGGIEWETGTPLSDTWIFDGTDWTEQHPATAPSARFGSALTTLANGDVLLFGGTVDTVDVLNDTWVFDGTDWSAVDGYRALPTPVAMATAALPDGDIVAFGGTVSLSSSTVSDETWEFDGVAWRHLPTPHSPPARTGASMVTLANGDLLLTGGTSPGSGTFDDTWVFDGTDWTQLVTPTTRPGVSWASMVTLANGDVLSFGGMDATNQATGETWLFDGSDWSRLDDAGSPPARVLASMSVLPNGNVVLFGGAGADYASLSDTWIFDGARWTEQHPTNAPPARFGASMAALGDGNLLLFGGTSFGGTVSAGDTWTFDGTDWTLQAPDPSPAARSVASMVTRPDGTVVLVGGTDTSTDTTYYDTWVWTP
ncbi:MAG TPA: kelch repeat-containing protein [Acidimicrobiales bacterium]|nr:kelch repeat-containing protein [Acidimicrobiales bacterium]